MGYSTRYSLTFEPHTEENARRFKEVYNAEPEYGIRYALNEDGDSEDTCKWYEHLDDMMRISSLLPDLLFTLHGEGEESGDIWNAYFLCGQGHYERAKIVIGEFNPEKLRATKKEILGY